MSFTSLGENVISLSSGDQIQQILEVITETSSPITFSVYSNSTYPSSYNMNTMTQVLVTRQGNVGQQLVISGTGEMQNSSIAFILPLGTQLYNNTECLFVLTHPTTITPTANTEFYLMLGEQQIRVITPYNVDSGNAIIQYLDQVNSTNNAVNGTTYFFKGFIQIDSGDNMSVIIDEDNLSTIQNAINNKTTVNINGAAQTTLSFDSDPQTQIDDINDSIGNISTILATVVTVSEG